MYRPRNGPHRAAAPWGLLGALVLAILVESWVHRHWLDLSPLGVTGYWFAGRASRESGHDELICLGDSLVKGGMVPRVLEARLGKKTSNIACCGAPSPLTYFLLKRSLDAGARPAALLVSFKATSLQSELSPAERPLSEVLDASEVLDLALTARDPGLLARLAVSWLLPSVRARTEIRAWAVSAAQGRVGSNRQGNLVVLRNWSVNRGAALLEKNPDVEAVSEYWDERINTAPYPWYCQPINAVYLKRFLVLTAARGIPVYWLVPPINPRVQARRDSLGLDKGFDRMLRRAVAQHPNLTVIDGRGAGYPTRHFVDSAHLDAAGAALYSDDVASLLAGAPSGPPGASRWLALPAYRPRPIAVPLEDYSGSRVAPSDGGDRTRR